MIAEPIKAKQNLQFVSNLLYAIKKQEKEEKSDQIDKAKKIFPKLQPIENIKEITDELISELSSIPNQLEYLIDESFPYDSNTFIEELENGKIDMIYQILFFCMIHTLDASIIYESGSSKELREYQVMYSCNSEDSFHSNSPPRNTRKDIIFNYYIFVNQDGTTEVMTCNQNQSQISFQPLKSHSFQVQQIHQAHNVAKNQLAMTFDASIKNTPHIPKRVAQIPKIPEIIPSGSMIGQEIPSSGPGMRMYPPGTYGGHPPQHMFIPKQPNLSTSLAYPPASNKLNMTVMETLNSNNSLNRSANLSLNNSYNIDPLEINDKFNHSMNIGGVNLNKPGLINPPPGLTKFQGGPIPYGQAPQFLGHERMINHPPNSYFQMNHGMGMGNFPPPPPPSTINQPPINIFCPSVG